MKILVIETVYTGAQEIGRFPLLYSTAFTLLPTLMAREIVAITPSKYDVRLVNEWYEDIPFDSEVDIVHINFSLTTTSRAFEIADEFRERGVFVVMSGHLCNVDAEYVLSHSDSVLQGRGELEWLAFLCDFEKDAVKQMYQAVPYDDTVLLPSADVRLDGFVMMGAVEATRGCPYKCDFCFEQCFTKGNSYFKRPVEEVIEEIKRIPYRAFQFYDLSMTVDKQYSLDLFESVKPLKKKFFCSGNSDVLAEDPEFVRASHEAGCVAWLVGFESFSSGALKEMKKSTNRKDEYFAAVKNVHDQNMAMIGSFVFGFDADDSSVFASTLEAMNMLDVDAADLNILTPFPGTPLYARLKQQGRILSDDWSLFDRKHAVFEPAQMSPVELEEGVRWLYQSFYSPKAALGRSLRSLRYGFWPFSMIVTRNGLSYLINRPLVQED